MPYSIGLLTALFRREGFTVDLFDTTFYVDEVNKNYDHHDDHILEYEWKEKGRIFKSNIINNFHKKIEEFDPLGLLSRGEIVCRRGSSHCIEGGTP